MDISDSMVPSSQNEKPGSEIITVHVKDIQGGTLPFQVKLDDNVSTLIQKYKNMKSLGNAQVIIYLKGKALKEKQTFKDLDIEDGEIFHSVTRLKGGY